MRKSLNTNLNNETFSYSQSMKTNEKINEKHKTVCLSNTTETREEDVSKYTIKNYCGIIIVVFIGILYIYYIVKYNLLGWIINQIVSHVASFFKFFIKLNTRMSSFNNYSKRVGKIITGFSLISKESICWYPVEFVSESITFGLNCSVLNYTTLFFLFISNVASLSYLKFIATALSLLL